MEIRQTWNRGGGRSRRSLRETSAIAVARQFRGRQRHGNGETCGTRDYAVSTVGGNEEHMRRESRNQEQLDAQGRDEDGDCEEALRPCIWQPLGLLTTVKPPALRERHDASDINGLAFYHLIRWSLANASEVDVEEALTQAIEKYRARLASGGSASSGR